jgi:hypothetical protein
MGQQFDRVAIVTPGGTEEVILESQLIVDYGQGQGPLGGVITVKDGFVTILGSGEARLGGGFEEQGGTFPARLALTGEGKLAVEIVAHEDPTGQPPKATVYLEGSSATLRMHERIFLDGTNGDVWLGGKDAHGDMMLYNKDQQENRDSAKSTIRLAGALGQITLRSATGKDRVFLDGTNGDLWLGGKNAHGDIMLYNKDQQENRDSAKSTIRLAGALGQITLRSATGEDRIFLDGTKGDLWLGGKNVQGDIMLFSSGEDDNRNSAKATIRLNGGAGDIVLQNADCAEEFDISDSEQIQPGSVMVLDSPAGTIRQCTDPYDKKVAGVISGAGNLKPGLLLDKKPGPNRRLPVAMLGKVYCKADANFAPIEIGDLLTTSQTPGHAMKAADSARAFGAVIGKALSPLSSGLGLIPILVNLQ